MKRMVIVVFIAAMLLQIAGIGAYAESSSAFALPEKLLNAEYTSSEPTDEGDGMFVLYYPASEEDFEYYINLSNLCGTYSCYMDDVSCYLMRPEETSHVGLVICDAEKQILVVRMLFDAEGNLDALDETDLEADLELFDRNLILPEGSGKNTFPQFYASAGKLPYFQMTQECPFFDGKDAWSEYYAEITTEDLRQYTKYMMLFGFDLRIESVSKMDDGNTMHVLHYSNGDAEVYVLYMTETQETIVMYKPGVTYYLLSAGELETALGGN